MNNLKEMKNDEILQMVATFNEEKSAAQRCLKKLKRFDPVPGQRFQSSVSESSRRSRDDTNTMDPTKRTSTSRNQAKRIPKEMSVQTKGEYVGKGHQSSKVIKYRVVSESKDAFKSSAWKERTTEATLSHGKAQVNERTHDHRKKGIFETTPTNSKNYKKEEKNDIHRIMMKKRNKFEFRVLKKDPFFRNLKEKN